MIRLAVFLIGSSLAAPAFAQHGGHGQTSPATTSATATAPAASTPAGASTCTPEHAAMGHCIMPPEAPPSAASTCTAEHAAMGHCTMPQAPPPPAPKPPATTCTPEHAAMGHCTMPEPAPAPASTCTPEHAAMGHCTLPQQAPPPPAPTPPASTCTPEHAAMGHCTPATATADPHGGHEMAPSTPPPVAPPPAEALSGPPHAADTVFDPVEMAQARSELAEEHGGLETWKFLVDQLEAVVGSGNDGYSFDAQFWYGGDIDKLWLKSEGEGEFGGGFEGAELQALWSHAIDPWFDLQIGVRQDIGPRPDRTHLVLGAQGLAPYWFELDGAVFVSTQGEVTAGFEAEYDLRLTQRLILQPRLEASFSLQDIDELELGSGLTTSELGARLRYEIHPERGPAVIAPYLGVQYERAFGQTARYRRSSGEDVDGLSFLVGLRIWF